VYLPETNGLMSKAEEVARTAASVQRNTSPAVVEAQITRALSSFFYRETRRKPVVTAAVVDARP
jgi:mRNA degradation ribonuclease J1/J2